MGHAPPHLKGWTWWPLLTQSIPWCVTLPAHHTPQLLCSVVTSGTKAAAGAAYIIPCIWFFVLVSVMSKPAKKWPQHILAGGGWGSPGGSIHMPHVWPSRGWGATAQPGPQGGVPLLPQPQAGSWKQSIKDTKGTGWDFHILSGHWGVQPAGKPQVCKNRKNSKKAAGTKSGFHLAVTRRAGQPWDVPGWSPSPWNAPSHTRLFQSSRAASVTHSQLQDSITVPLGCTWDGLHRQQPLKTGMIICRFFHSYNLSLIWKIKCLCPIVNYS